MRGAVVVWGLVSVGCFVDRGVTDATSTGGAMETTSGTSGATSTGTTGVTPTTSTGDGTDPSGFLGPPDGGQVDECDVFAQDCAEGQKCAPWVEGGGTGWNALKCVPVTGAQLPGQPCTAPGGGTTGRDDCVEGALCWPVDAQNQGTCVALCGGSERMPTCPANAMCAVTGDGVLAVCRDRCDPLLQDCADDQLCLPVHDGYACDLDASGALGASFDPCEYVNACDKGLLCLAAAAAAECDPMAAGCCLPMCSIAEGGAACPGAGQQCLPLFDPQPPGYEDVGLCSLP